MPNKSSDEAFSHAVRVLRSPRWSLYYARWERRWTLRLGGRAWTVLADIDAFPVRRGGPGFARVAFVRADPMRAETKALIRDPEFKRIAAELQAAGYQPLVKSLVRSQRLFHRFPATRRGLKAERQRVDTVFGTSLPSRSVARDGDRLALAMAEFSGTGWEPSGAGWSLRDVVAIKDGGAIRFSIMMVQRRTGTLISGRDLRAEADVMVTPSGRSPLPVIERVKPVIVAAGYRGGPQQAYSTKTGRPSWVFGEFGRNLPLARLSSERKRLERLAADLANVEQLNSLPRGR